MPAKFHDYYAFICHRSADKPLALAIQKKLEQYRIPRKIIEDNGYPSTHIRHVCVDITEFEDSNLHSDILNCLEKSQKLIVLCSELSASPVNGETHWVQEGQIDWRKDPVATGWVGFEILNFINMDQKAAGMKLFTCLDDIRRYLDDNVEQLNDQEYRKAHPEVNPFRNIIPVVKDGDPIARTCFHPIIQLAIDRGLLKWYMAEEWNLKIPNTARKHRSSGNFIDLILAVLAPSDIQEFRRRDKIRRRIQKITIAGLILFMLVTLGLLYDYRVPHVAYYQDYVLEDELPKGIQKISKREISQQTDCYRITTTKYNRTLRLEHINSLGTPVEEEQADHPNGPMIAEYKCRQNWKPDVCEYLDRNGIVQMTYSYATDLGYVTFQENDFVSNQVYPIAKLNDYGIPDHLKIDRYGLVHDDQGRLTEKMYMSGVNYVYDDKGVAGERYEYDSEGRIACIHYINREKEDVNNQNGVHGIRLNYRADGTFSGYTYLNADGQNTYGTEGYSEMRIEQDGSSVITSYHDPDGSLLLCDDGYARAIANLNEYQQISEITYYGREEQSAYYQDSYHKVLYTYNENGDLTKTAFQDENGNLIIGKNGYAVTARALDSRGNILKEEYFGSEETPILLSNMASSIEREYSDTGFLVKESYYGVDGSPVYISDGYQSYVNEYDEKNRRTSTAYYGFDGKKSFDRAGYHRIEYAYDDKGNMTGISLYNASGDLVPYSGYWAKQLLTYNGGGLVTKVEYLDQFEKPVDVVGGYAVIENQYDDTGLLLQTAYYDHKGELCTDSYVNDMGVLVGTRYYAKIAFTYDDRGNVIQTDYYDKEDQLLKNYLFSSIWNEYDAAGHLIRTGYLDAEGKEAEEYFGAINYQYDSYGHVVDSEYFGKDNTPLAISTATGTPAHRILLEKDPRGKILKMTIYDTSDTQAEQVEYTYDDNGRELTQSFYDVDHARTTGKDGYAIRTYEYDSMGNLTREAYYDVQEKLFRVAAGYAVCKKEYNANGVTDLYYYDENEKPVDLAAGYSHFHEDLNEYRNTVNAEFRDQDDQLLFSYQVEYNKNAQKTREVLYGPDGELYAQPGTGVAIRTLAYDEKGNQTEETYWATEDTRAMIYGEFSGWQSDYTEESLEASRTYYGADGAPIMISEGFATAKFLYDEYGREVERQFLDAEGQPVNTKFGFASYKIEYDEQGEIQSYTCYDKDGRECSVDGTVKKVEVNLHNGDVQSTGTGAIAKTVYNIYRIAYQSKDGDYDLMLQPYVPLSPSNYFAAYIQDIKAKGLAAKH